MIKIIIVDDHILFREGLKAIIRLEADIEIIGQAGSVEEATELVLSRKPDIVLMDFSLPDGNGVDATRTILAQYPQCKIIFLTMSEKDDDLYAAVRGGAKGFVSKNVPTARLVAAIRAVQNGESALSPAMTLRVMQELARTRPAETQQDPRLAKLTEREMDVLNELASGRSNKEIARHLVLSENTVKYYVHSILAKLNLSDRKSAAQMALEFGIGKNKSSGGKM